MDVGKVVFVGAGADEGKAAEAHATIKPIKNPTARRNLLFEVFMLLFPFTCISG
jgi:hypothetical protein